MCFSPLKCLAAWISRLWVHPRGRAGWQSHVERPGSPRPGDLGISNENGDFAKKNMEISWDIRGYDIWYNYDIWDIYIINKYIYIYIKWYIYVYIIYIYIYIYIIWYIYICIYDIYMIYMIYMIYKYMIYICDIYDIYMCMIYMIYIYIYIIYIWYIYLYHIYMIYIYHIYHTHIYMIYIIYIYDIYIYHIYIWYIYDIYHIYITYCPKLTQNMVDLWGRYHIHYTYREKLCFLWRILHGISPSKWPSGGIPQFHPNWRYRTGGAWINDWDLIIWPRKVG